MKTVAEMRKWNYEKTWRFFSENAYNRLIPETELYIRSTTACFTEDLRSDTLAYKKIIESINKKSLILIDGSSMNGKSTFANRLAKHIKANIIDIDLICKDWIEEQIAKKTNPIDSFSFMMEMHKHTDEYILKNLERIIKEKSKKGNVILVGCYMEVVYRTIIANTLGKYFEQTISMYCCAKRFKEIKMMKQKREREFGASVETDDEVWNQYNYSKRLLEGNGIMLSFGMSSSFIVDINVSDMFA